MATPEVSAHPPRARRGRAAPAPAAAGIDNAAIAAVLDEMADILDVEGANPFRIRAYRNAARAVGSHGEDIGELLRSGGGLPRIPGIGADLAGKIAEIVQTGSCALREQLRQEVSPAIVTLLGVAGLGPKRVQRLYRELGVRTPEELLAAAQAGRVRALRGFGERSERKLLAALQTRLQTAQRLLRAQAEPVATRLCAALRELRGVREVAVAGSYRRGRETVGDLDLLVACARGRAVVDLFTGLPEVQEVMATGETRAAVRLRSGLQVDLRVVAPSTFGAALVYFTGGKAHNIAIRRRAQQAGLKISEYGVFRGEQRVAGATETSVYAALGLPWIPPELRENRGEIEAAAAGRLPRLLERKDLRGDLHAHTVASDGRSSLEEMAQAARAAGLEYLAITEHSQQLSVARGLSPQRLRAHIAWTWMMCTAARRGRPVCCCASTATPTAPANSPTSRTASPRRAAAGWRRRRC